MNLRLTEIAFALENKQEGQFNFLGLQPIYLKNIFALIQDNILFNSNKVWTCTFFEYNTPVKYDFNLRFHHILQDSCIKDCFERNKDEQVYRFEFDFILKTLTIFVEKFKVENYSLYADSTKDHK